MTRKRDSDCHGSNISGMSALGVTAAEAAEQREPRLIDAEAYASGARAFAVRVRNSGKHRVPLTTATPYPFDDPRRSDYLRGFAQARADELDKRIGSLRR